MSEKLSIATYLSKTPTATLDEVVIRLQSDLPERSHSVESSGPLFHSLMSSVVVPTWFHEEIMQFDTISMQDYNGDEFITALISKAPASAPVAFRDRDSMIKIANTWISYCINPLKRHPKLKACHRLGDTAFWTLSAGQISEFMGIIALGEHERLRRERLKRSVDTETERRSDRAQLAQMGDEMDRIARSVIPASLKAEAPTVSPDEPLPSWSARSRILYFMRSNRRMNDADLVSLVQPPVTKGDIALVRSEVDMIADVPEWLHDCMWFYRRDCQLENSSLMSCISDRKPRNYSTARTERLVPLWNTYCIQPLEEYFSSEDLLPLPCEFDVKTKRYNLSDHRWDIYISDQLVASTAV